MQRKWILPQHCKNSKVSRIELDSELINFIRPEIQDTELFRFFSRPSSGAETNEGGARRDNVVEAFEECDQNTQLSQLLLQDKFRGDQDTTVIDELFIEGFLKLNDPAGDNDDAQTVLNDSDSPGIYIGGTRAFSQTIIHGQNLQPQEPMEN